MALGFFGSVCIGSCVGAGECFVSIFAFLFSHFCGPLVIE